MIAFKIVFIISILIALFSSFINCENDSNSSTITTKKLTTTKITTTTTVKPKANLATTCTLNKSSPQEKGLLTRVLNLGNKQLTIEDGDHEYFFGICTKADNALKSDEAFIQVNKKTKKQVVIGRLNDVDLEGTSQWIRIQFKNGDKYPHVCNQANRNAVVFILCNPDNSSDIFEMIEENHHREGDSCSYIFQLSTPQMCTFRNNSTTPCPSNTTTSANNSKKSHKLGFVSISLMIVFSLVVVYFIVGTVYNRYVKQSRGIEQLPHYELWSMVGMKSADCFNFLCRCGKKPSEIRNYEHISDRLSDDDENLLNM